MHRPRQACAHVVGAWAQELVVLNTAAKKLSPYHQSFFDVCEERSDWEIREGMFEASTDIECRMRRMQLISRQLSVRMAETSHEMSRESVPNYNFLVRGAVAHQCTPPKNDQEITRADCRSMQCSQSFWAEQRHIHACKDWKRPMLAQLILRFREVWHCETT